MPDGFYIAHNHHAGYHGLATVQLFNISGFQGDNKENMFYSATELYTNLQSHTFSIKFNPYTREIKTEHVTEKRFVLYRIGSFDNGYLY